MIGFRVNAIVEHSFVGFVLVDGLQLAAHEPDGGIEPLQDEGDFGENEVEGVMVVDVSEFVAEDCNAALLDVLATGYDVMHPAEGRYLFFVQAEDGVIVERLPLPFPQLFGKAEVRNEASQRECGHAQEIDEHQSSEQDVRCGNLCCFGIFDPCCHHQHPFEGYEPFTRTRTFYQRFAQGEHKAEHKQAHQRHTIEPMERLAAHQQLVEQIIDDQKHRRLEDVCKEGAHRFIIYCFPFSTCSISSLSSSTETFSSLTSAEMALTYEPRK